MLDSPFKEAIAVLNHIEEHGHEAYFVGGCVRDYLLGREIRDVDIATSATPQFIQKIFDKVIPVGIEHGTVIVRHQQTSYEVTTFRIDGTYSDSRHPDHVAFISKIDKDLKRRDFTINAMAMDKKGKVIDLYQGREDISDKVIRTVGNGYDRFKEDPLRMVRALRFASQLGFTLDSETQKQIKTLRREVNTIAVERIAMEMEKFFAGNYIADAIKELQLTGLHKNLPVLKQKPAMIDALQREQKPLFTLAEMFAFFHLLDPTVSIMTWIREWKASNQTKRDTIKLVEAVREFQESGIQNWIVYKLPGELYEGFIRVLVALSCQAVPSLQEMYNMEDDLPIMSRQQLCFNGNDLIELFPQIAKGPWMQKILIEVEYLVVIKELTNDKEKIKEWLKWNPPEIS
ncbi:CCA tRNA nucleotidyltransferase [Oceanobacillus manasiensis]|uniref:CCA tRNA nucleotidyltransferase n=1 Tax=Oceanobacillus manasiensis TaxID=586413 RepID=UPI0005A98D7D|nr:CCA tRNA nucleotidyltransferase [Oceanobacillus manasiensis]